MADVIDYSRPDPDAIRAGHEASLVNVRALRRVGIGLVVVLAASFLAMVMLFRLMERDQEAADRATGRTAVVGAAKLAAPEPRLQGIPGFHTATPAADMALMREQNRKLLTEYGPTPEPGFIRIPVDRAMDLAIQRQLFPTRAPTTQEGGGHAR